MGYKGFQCVEAKPNKRDKTKPRSEEHEAELSPTAAAFRSQPKVQTAAQAKPKLLPGENPIDPRQVKADLKAARALQKNYANQVAPSKPKTQQQQQPHQTVEKVDHGAWGTVPKATASSVSIPISGGGGGGGTWASKSNAGLRGAGVLKEASHFVDLPSAGDFQPDVRHAGGARQPIASNATNDATALWKQVKGTDKGGKKKAAEQPKTHTAQTLVLGKVVKPAVEKEVKVEAEVDELLADPSGAALPISIAPIMLTADGKSKEISLSGSLDKMATKCEQYISGMPKNANAVANLPIRGGLFMTVGGKKFSEVSTIFEPWMAESYFKALTAIVSGESDTAVAHPYYQHGPNGQQVAPDVEPVEATLAMKIIRANPKDNLFAPTTLIELEHVGAHNNKAQLRKVRVSFKSFAQGMVRAGEALVNFRETLEDVLEKSPLRGAAGAEITKKFAGKFNMTLATYKKALDAATASA